MRRGILILLITLAVIALVSADTWPDETRLSDIEERMVCRACGTRGADVRPDWSTKGPRAVASRCRNKVRRGSHLSPE
jgi:hypothetical protein